MKFLFGTFLLALVFVSCRKSAWSDFAFQEDMEFRDLAIDQHREGFFIMRYRAYQGEHDIGGTQNEISIRNLSSNPLKVETLSLVQMFRGQNVTQEGSPIPYNGLYGGIVIRNAPTKPKDIESGEWISFDFPTKEIQEFEVGDKMHLTLSVSLRAGTQHYTRIVEFTKTLAEVELPAL